MVSVLLHLRKFMYTLFSKCPIQLNGDKTRLEIIFLFDCQGSNIIYRKSQY